MEFTILAAVASRGGAQSTGAGVAPGEGSYSEAEKSLLVDHKKDWRSVFGAKVCEKGKRRSRVCGCPLFGKSEKKKKRVSRPSIRSEGRVKVKFWVQTSSRKDFG